MEEGFSFLSHLLPLTSSSSLPPPCLQFNCEYNWPEEDGVICECSSGIAWNTTQSVYIVSGENVLISRASLSLITTYIQIGAEEDR